MKKLTSVEQQQIVGGKVYECPICGFKTKWYIKLGFHETTMHGDAGMNW